MFRAAASLRSRVLSKARIMSVARHPLWIIGITATGWFLLTEILQARVGGGHSYSNSSPSSHSSSSSSGESNLSSSDIGFLIRLVYLLIRLHFEAPVVALALDGGLAFVYIIYRKNRGKQNFAYAGPKVVIRKVQNLKVIPNIDREFSLPSFLDFAYTLIAKSHEMRGDAKLQELSSYLSKNVILALSASQSTDTVGTSRVVIGTAQARDAVEADGTQVITLICMVKADEQSKDGKTQAWYYKERWVFTRSSGVRSHPPADTIILRCPACGGSLEKKPYGSCQYCGEKIESGKFDWFVRSWIQDLRRTEGPQLTEHVAEVGIDLPTIMSPSLDIDRQKLFQSNPGAEQKFLSHVQKSFLDLQQSWSAQKWEQARWYETDSLFQTHIYWIEEYKRQGVRNILDKVQIEKMDIVDINQDAYYESITLRIYASMLDYTVEVRSGKVRSGSRDQIRRFSEYWTFLKRRDQAGQPKQELNLKNCPNCGSQFEMQQSGVCPYCSTKVCSGRFYWVLSRIEQDEEYGQQL